jgi:hypothetical protein
MNPAKRLIAPLCFAFVGLLLSIRRRSLTVASLPVSSRRLYSISCNAINMIATNAAPMKATRMMSNQTPCFTTGI